MFHRYLLAVQVLGVPVLGWIGPAGEGSVAQVAIGLRFFSSCPASDSLVSALTGSTAYCCNI